MKHVLTFLCLLGAVGLYIAGSATGAAALLVAGLLLEGVFWVRVFRKQRD
jgi:hypothetical protein